MNGEVVPPILTAEQVAAYRTAVHADAPSLADLLASHEALRAENERLRALIESRQHPVEGTRRG